MPFSLSSSTHRTRTDLGQNRGTDGEQPVANRLNGPQLVQTELGNVSIGRHREILSAQWKESFVHKYERRQCLQFGQQWPYRLRNESRAENFKQFHGRNSAVPVA